jgi:N-lysine methyltransferase SETD6
MRTIRPIGKHEQIYNTYGNLPNADLLRRYGYVIPGSKDDLVEISAEMIIETVSRLTQDEVSQRVDILDDEDLFEEYERPPGTRLTVGLMRFRFPERYRMRCWYFVYR